jgi:beta-glucosidase-like glycosyl hydrolase
MTHLAFEAGLDIYLMCHTLEKQVEVLETLMKIAEDPRIPKMMWDAPLRRILETKQQIFNHESNVDRAHALELIGAREHIRISRRLREDLNKKRSRLEAMNAEESEASSEPSPDASADMDEGED